MSDAPQKIDLLIVRYLEGELSRKEFAAFDKLVRDNANVRRRLMDAAQTAQCIKHVLAGGLVQNTRNIPMLGGPDEGSTDRSNFDDILAALDDTHGEATQPVDISDVIKRRESEARAKRAESLASLSRKFGQTAHQDAGSQTRHYVIPKPLFYGGIAAIVVVVAAIIWPMFDQPVNPIQTPAVPVAMLTSEGGAVWDTGETPVKVGDPVLNVPMRLKEGWITLKFHGGSHVMIEAPAEFTPIAGDRIEMQSGKLSGYCDESARGFVVGAPGVTIQDLGTEFATHTLRNGRTDVHVFDGSVRATIKGEEENISQDVVNGSAIRLNLQSRRLQAIDLDPEQFRTTRLRKIDIPNTGVGALEGRPDRNWKITAVEGDPNFVLDGEARSAIVITPDRATYLENGQGNDQESQWISWGRNMLRTPGGATYTFQTSFNVQEALDPQTVRLKVRVIVDDMLSGLRLNGKSVEGAPRGRLQPNSQYFEFLEFEIDSGFVRGENILEFDVHNSAFDEDVRSVNEVSPMAIRVEISGEATLGAWWEQNGLSSVQTDLSRLRD